jgi:hypothetical protein
MIEITNSKTHEFKHFADGAAVTEFLEARDDAADWTGHEPHIAATAAPAGAEPEAHAEPQAPQSLVAKVKARVKKAIAPAKKSAKRK